ncbi:MAG: hypothetical protein ABI167_08855 [Nitrosospira sp.]
MRSACLECEGAGQRILPHSRPLVTVPIADQTELRSENIATLDPHRETLLRLPYIIALPQVCVARMGSIFGTV